MHIQTSLFILLAAFVALGVVLYQYYFKTKKQGNLGLLLSFLRFVSVFGLLLLLINPKFSKTHMVLEKPNLLIVTDNSSSVKNSAEFIGNILKSLGTNGAILDKFDLRKYAFGNDIRDSDSLTFSERNTRIDKALSTLNDVYAKTNTAIVLVTDGNQTIGKDYGLGGNYGFPVYPVVVGDTTRFEDIRIAQVNANRYAFLKNKFPVEIYVAYEGQGNANATVSVEMEGKVVHRENVNFTNVNNSGILNILIEAGSVGTKSLKVGVSPLPNERNLANNQKNLLVEVIDEKTHIAIISDVLHPDIGALKKAIERNEQRSVSLRKTTAVGRELEGIDLFILYRPDSNFKGVFDQIAKSKAGYLVITGAQTDWHFLNRVQTGFQVAENYPVQEVFPKVNKAFSRFDISEFSFEGYPPLESDAGDIVINGQNETLLSTQIKGMETLDPLLVLIAEENSRQAILFGENLWKWRMHSYRESQDFKNFDDFIGKLILYLTSVKPVNRLQVDHKSIYEVGNEAKITATYFDEGFEFDPNANISLRLKNTIGVNLEMPMLLKNGYYEADLSALTAGDYDFTLNVLPENRSATGKFTILDFDVEQQFPSSDFKNLHRLATHSTGAVYFPGQMDSLVQKLVNDDRFRPIQGSSENVVSLIDFRTVFAIILAALALEWFIRKYNGLI